MEKFKVAIKMAITKTEDDGNESKFSKYKAKYSNMGRAEMNLLQRTLVNSLLALGIDQDPTEPVAEKK